LAGFTVRFLKDGRTLNKRVIAYGEVLSQNEIHTIIERATAEKLELTEVNILSHDLPTSIYQP